MKHRKIKNGNMKGEQLEDRIRRFSVCVCVYADMHTHTYFLGEIRMWKKQYSKK